MVGGQSHCKGFQRGETEKGGGRRCKQARNDSFLESMSLGFANRRPCHQSGFNNKMLAAEHRFLAV